MRMMIVAAVVATAAVARADGRKFVGFAWEFSRMSITNLVEYAEELDKTPLDGIGVYLNERTADGALTSTHNVMHTPWRKDALEPLVPLARELTSHRSMKESFIGTFRAPVKRIGWADDAGWARVASNMMIAAWFAKAGGFRGISMDPEDYHHAGQFVRNGGDVPYDELRRLARRRGREVFGGVFREYPDIRILSFWFLSKDFGYLASADPKRDMRSRGDLWPAFVDGIFDVMPQSARFIDGCEHSYRYESSRGDFYRAADAFRRRLPQLLDPAHGEKYRNLTSLSFGIYLDMFTNKEGSSWYFAPVEGSRLRHFEHNLTQAADAADEYVWFWGERHCWADWRGKGPDDDRKISAATWDQAVSGLNDTVLAVKNPVRYAVKRYGILKADGTQFCLNDNVECRSDNGGVPRPYSTWQQKKCRQGRLFADAEEGDGDTFSLGAEGAENGLFTVGTKERVLPGDRLLVTVSAKGEGTSAMVAWKNGGKWDWNVCSPVQLNFSAPDGCGWKRSRTVVRMPEGVDGLGLILSVRQNEGEKANFDNVAIYRLDGRDVYRDAAPSADE